jgi:outer membrane autotransporter protein
VLSAAGPIAVLVQDSGSSITLDNTEIEAVSGPLLIGYGLRVQNNAEGTVSGGSISTNGRDSPGIAASGGGFVSATDVTIVTSGPDNAMGVIADLDGRIELTGGSVTTTGNEVRAGARPHGLVARNPGGVLIANGTSVTTTGTIAMGVVADDGGTVGLSGNDILTFGTSSIGVFSITEQTGAQFEANATGDQLNIHTFGNLAHGVAAQSRNDISAPEAFASVSNSTVVTEGDNAVGLRAVLGDYGTRPITGRGEANVLAENTIVETHGAGAHGALSRDNPTSVTLNQTSILTTGFAAHGAVADFGGLIVGNEAEVRATGGQSAALYVVGNAVSNAIFTDSSLTNVSGPTIDVAGDGNVVLINTFVGGSGEWLRVGTTADFPPLAQQQLLRGVPDLPDPDPDVPPPTATPPLPPSGVTLPVPGFANIDVSDSLVIGSATTVAGSVSNVNMAGSTWEMTGNSNLTNLINDSSLIEFAAPTGDPLLLASYLTLTTVNYGGTGGILQLNTYLDTDGSPSDRLVIDGGTGSGSTALRIANSGGAGAVTLANGILVVDAINGATTAPGIFTLAGPVVAGPYDYSLFRGGPIAGFENDWFLRSLLDCTLEPNNPACDDPGPDPDLRPEVSLYAAIPSLALTYGRTLLDTLHERVGEEEDQRGQALAPRLGWGRIIGTHGDHEGGPDGILGDGPEYDYDIFALQAGADLWRREDVDGSRDQAGVYFAFGGTRGDVTHIDGTEGDTDFDAASLGGYWTHFGPEGWYVDGVLQGTFYDIESTAHRGIAALETDAFGVGASVEAGYPIHLDDGYFIEPQVQAVFQTVDIDDASDVGAEIHFDDADSLAARIGARLGRTFVIDEIERRTLTVWLRPNIWNEFLGDPTTSFSSATGFIPFKSEIDGFTGEINAGISGEIDGNITLYANASYFSSADGDDTAFDGKIGLRAVW